MIYIKSMKMMLLSLFCLLSFVANAVPNNKKFILITSLYNEDNQKRAKEYLYCLNRNIKHDSIEKIHVVYDTTRDVMYQPEANLILKYLKSHPSITITYVKNRPKYKLFFDLAKKYYPKRKIILSNADIYFDKTLRLLNDYDLTNKFLSLTRWDVRPHGKLQPAFNYRLYGSDTWIFLSSIPKFEDLDIVLGTSGCDHRIMYQAYKANLTVLNPAMDIRCNHLHISDIRHHDRHASKHSQLFVRAGKLTDKTAKIRILKEYNGKH